MKKILIILITIPMIFSSCEKDDENNNNNNIITDNIVGEWVNFGESGYLNGENNIRVYIGDPYIQESISHFNFFSDGTLELYVSINGVSFDEYKSYGNWTKVNGSSYDISYTYNNDGQQEIVQEIATTIFYCDNNIFRTTFDSDLDFDYWQKNGYDYQVCTDNYIQQ